MKPLTTPLTGSELRTIRKRLNLSQGELGDMLGKTQATVSRFENGTTIPRDTAIAVRAIAREAETE